MSAVAAQLVAIGLAARTLDVVTFGVLALFLGTLGLLDFLDLGIGNAVLTRVSRMLEENDTAQVRMILHSAAAALGVIAVAAIGLVLVSSTFLLEGLLRWLNVPSEKAVLLSSVIFLISLALGMPMSLGTKIALAAGRGHWNSATMVAASLATLVSASVLTLTDGGLVGFTVAFISIPVLANGVETVIVLRTMPDLLGHGWSGTIPAATEILKAGIPYFLFSLAAVANYQTQSGVVAYVMGPVAVGIFGVTARMFNAVTTLFSGGLQQTWAVLARATVVGRREIAKETLFKTTGMVFAAALIICGVLVASGQTLVSTWTGEGYTPTYSVLLGMALWTVYRLTMTPVSYLLHANNRVWPQSIANLGMCLGNLPLMVWLTGEVGLAGPAIASTVCHLLFVGPVLVVLGARAIRQSTVA